MAGDAFVSPKMPPISTRTDFFRSLLMGILNVDSLVTLSGEAWTDLNAADESEAGITIDIDHRLDDVFT